MRVRLPDPCCIRALAEQWQVDRLVVCPECLLPYTAVLDGGEHSWWPGVADYRQVGTEPAADA